MRPVMGDFSLSFAVKCVLSALLLLTVYHLYGSLGERNRGIDGFITVLTALYTAVCAVHIISLIRWNSGI